MHQQDSSSAGTAPVLVTGASGLIGGHCILQLLERGFAVRGTLRSLAQEAPVRAALSQAGMAKDADLRFVAADLTGDGGWREALAGVSHVLHVASPVRPGPVARAEELVVPAREGTLRVLRAAREAGARRVVVTSAFHAAGWGHPHDGRTFTEADWTCLDGPGVDAYGRSKTLAERAAWDFLAREGGALELVALLPVAVMGPALGRQATGSNHLIELMLEGRMAGYPNLFIPIVDVRDVAAAHVLAMLSPQAAGERFLLSSGPAMALEAIGAVIRSEFGAAANRVPTRSVPDAVVRLGALFSPRFRAIASDLGYARKVSSDKARRVLGWMPRAPREAILAAAASLMARRG